jgi:hypothetical protein
MLSVLGLGHFSYYQGRSHDYTLTAVWWPAFILLTISAGMLYRHLTGDPGYKTTGMPMEIMAG